MPNVIKYTTGTTPSGCLRKGNMLIGNNTADYGLTFFNGIDSPAGGYTVYLNKASGGPSIYCPTNNTQLISITNQIAGTNYTTAAQCLEYFASQTDKIVVNGNYGGVVTNGLLLNLDAGFIPSYPTTSSTWYDISGNTNNGTLVNGPTYSSGSIVFDGVDDIVSFPAITLGSTFTISQTLVASAAYNSIGYMPIGGGHVVSGSTYRGYVWFQTNNDATNPVGATVALVFNQDGEAGGFSFGLPTSIPRYTLFQYTLVKNGSTAYFYINGSLITTQSVESGRNFTVRNLGWSYSSYYMNRNLYNTQIYNRALSTTEVVQNYIATSPIVTNGLVLNLDAGTQLSYISGSTTWFDVSSNNNNGILTGSVLPTFSTNPSTLVFTRGSITSLPENRNSVVCNNTVGNDMTVSSWIKTTQVGYNTQHYELMYIASSEKGGAANDWGFGINVNGRIAFGAGTNDGTISGSIVNTGIWCNVVATRIKDTGLVTLYVNGSLSNSGISNIGNTLDANPKIKIGSGDDFPAFSFGGSIATTLIYNRAITAAEVLQNYNAQKGRFGL